MKKVAEKYKLYPQMRFNHTVSSITWDDTYNKWRVLVADVANNNEQIEEQFDIV